jgi:hypothetical protein
MTMPKCTGSTPKLLTTGSRIGVQISSMRREIERRAEDQQHDVEPHEQHGVLVGSADRRGRTPSSWRGICIKAAM